MLISCVVKKISKAGIQAELKSDTNDRDYLSPLIIFISKEYYYDDDVFLNTKINDNIVVRIIGIRYELNDTFISAIGTILPKEPVPVLK